MLTRVAASVVATSALLLACAPAVTKASAHPEVARSGYVTIRPDVSVSRTAESAVAEHAAPDERGDVMAEILAIPPGR